MIKLHKYFYELTEYEEIENRQGNTQRSRTGKIFTDYTSDAYKTFTLTLENLTEKEHYTLVYLTSLIFPTNGSGQDISFTCPLGNEYTVTIPINGYEYKLRNTKENLWNWEITLEEVI